jgi:DNA processing protein
VKRTITRSAREWPPILNELGPHEPPRRLYAEGLPLDPDAAAVAVVGTRRPTASGVEVATRIARGLAQGGITVVSGLAIGIDATAHRAAMEAGGRTVAVLGTGLDVDYPARNIRLRQKILTMGTLLTEYADGTQPQRWHFPMRNRIIAGLSLGVVVVEGAHTSGALVTARLGLDANRSVYAIPGSVRNPMAAGPNSLIKSSQAQLVTSFEDVVEDLFGALGHIGRERRDGPVEELDRDEASVLGALDDVPVGLDTIVGIVGLPHGRVAVTAATLELRGLAIRGRGGYSITRKGAAALARLTEDGADGGQ